MDVEGAMANGAPDYNFAKNMSGSAFVGRCSCDTADDWWYCIPGECIRWSFMEYGSSDWKLVEVLNVRSCCLVWRDMIGFAKDMCGGTRLVLPPYVRYAL